VPRHLSFFPLLEITLCADYRMEIGRERQAKCLSLRRAGGWTRGKLGGTHGAGVEAQKRKSAIGVASYSLERDTSERSDGEDAEV
jgi:hypothetical protein